MVLDFYPQPPHLRTQLRLRFFLPQTQQFFNKKYASLRKGRWRKKCFSPLKSGLLLKPLKFQKHRRLSISLKLIDESKPSSGFQGEAVGRDIWNHSLPGYALCGLKSFLKTILLSYGRVGCSRSQWLYKMVFIAV